MQQFVDGVTGECVLVCSIRTELGDELMIVSCHLKEAIISLLYEWSLSDHRKHTCDIHFFYSSR
jgi:NTP pyrophosphatase (non-canonical NTP hydrolase)